MKKYISLTLVLAIMLILCGCGSSSANNNTAAASPNGNVVVITSAPTVTSVPAVTAVPVTPAPVTAAPVVVTDPVITKHPTPESLTAGGSCCFIAGATGYRYVSWQLVAPNGTIYDITSINPYPGVLTIWGASDTTLNLSNVPAEMDGWSARAVFTGDTQRVTTNGAAISVSRPVVANISFSEWSGTTFYSQCTYVNVYSSTGDPIRVECTQSGSSGAYYSQTLSSGGSFPVQGIYGQSVMVTVYASSKNSTATAYYYVSCEPVVVTKSGTVSYCDGNNAYIIFDDGTSGTYYISYYCSNPPSGGERCTCTLQDGTLIDFYYERVDPGPVTTTKSGWVGSCDGNYAWINFDDGSSGYYYIANFVSNPPHGGERCTCTFYGADNLTGFSYDYVDPGENYYVSDYTSSYYDSGSSSDGCSKTGTVDWCDGDNAGITFDNGDSGTYYISNLISNPPGGGERCVCDFDGSGNITGFRYL